MALDRRGSASSFWHSDNNGPSAWQFVIRDLPQKLQVKIQSLTFLTRSVVEKVHDISSKAIPEPAAFVEVERAYRIDFDIRTFAQDRTQFTLEPKRSLPYLRHGERNNAIRHSSVQWGTGEDAPSLHQEVKHSRLAGPPTKTDQRLTTSDGFIPG